MNQNEITTGDKQILLGTVLLWKIDLPDTDLETVLIIDLNRTQLFPLVIDNKLIQLSVNQQDIKLF